MKSPNTLQSRVGGGILLATVAILLIAAFVLFTQMGQDPQRIGERPTSTTSPTATLNLPTATPSPTPTIEPSPTMTVLPTADSEIVATSVARNVDIFDNVNMGDIAIGLDAEAYTINRDLERAGVIQYAVQSGDNLQGIADRYAISIETIIWSNDRFYVNAMRPGLILNILPVEGAIERIQDPISIQDLATKYQVDPYAIIDSNYNQLRGSVPENVLPEGLEVVIPGGIGSKEPIYWTPSGGASTTGQQTAGGVYMGTGKFGVGQSGSCGVQEIYNGTLPLFRPLYGYRLTTDFSWSHRGLDLSAPIGTQVNAVGGGVVIFAGWSDWGYGWSVVIAHGPVMSLYAHLTADFVYCGQVVEAGQHIGNVGSSGNSSGPHLHFEIRDASGTPLNPRDYLPF